MCYLLLFCVARGQINYVLNPSLEQYDSCPNNYDQIKYALHWTAVDSMETWYAPSPSATNGQPEYINTCNNSNSNPASAPQNISFFHYPRTGNGMAQVVMYFYQSGFGYNRDYLQGRLFKQLSAGKNYCVTFYATLEQQSNYSINHIGAYLDNGSIDTTIYPGMPQTEYTPQVVENAIISDTLNWIKIEESFTANGTEKFITIGNFFDVVHTDTATFNAYSSFTGDGVYLIDDVSVIESDHMAFAGNDTTIVKGDSILLGEIAVPYVWYKDSAGLRLMDSTSGGIWVKPDSTATYVVKQTLCGAVSWDTVVVSVMPVNVVNLVNMKNVLVYPNPVQNELIIEHAENCSIHIFDVVGREVYSGVMNQEKEMIDTRDFAKGVYFLEVKDNEGWQMIQKIVK